MSRIGVFILLLLLSFPAAYALLSPGGFTSHDLTHHVVRQISMHRLLAEGQIPPRWSGELNEGFGYPVFLFNYPLPALVGEVFHKFGLGFVDSVKAVLFSSMILSVLGMYLFLQALLKNKLASFLGAIFYLYAPIRFLTVYVSAAVGSALALGILPFVFWSLVEIKNGKKWAPLVGGLGFAGLILAHNVTTLVFAPVLLAFAWLIRGRRVIRFASWRIGIMFLLGLGLSAWFFLPAIFESQHTRFDEIFGAFYKDQFPTIWQLTFSPWGYGLSHPEHPEPGDMSYQIGKVHLLVMGILLVSFWFFKKVREFKRIGGFCLFFFFISIFLMQKISLPLWDSLPFLSYVQFPLRFSAISIFSASITVAILNKYLLMQKFVFLILLVSVLYANRNHWNINQVFDPGEEYYLNLKTTSTSYGEHLPKWGRMMDKSANGKFEFLAGSGQVKMIEAQSAKTLAEVEALEQAKLRFNQFYFPGWEMVVDGKLVGFDYLLDRESYGLPVFDIEKGKHQIKAEFKNTPIRNLADGLSLTSLILFLLMCVKIIL